MTILSSCLDIDSVREYPPVLYKRNKVIWLARLVSLCIFKSHVHSQMSFLTSGFDETVPTYTLDA